MIANPKVTVAIPVYNGANYLSTAIDSALKQDYENTEVIIVNDGSTDNGATDAVARSYGSRIKYIVQENKGVAGAMNTALAHMSGEIFTWLSHDDIHLPEKISEQVRYWHRLGRKDTILFSDYYLIDGEGRTIGQSNLPFEKYLEKPMLPLLQGSINGCTLFIPAQLLREFGPFDETLRYVQDYELWNKILARHDFFLQPRHLIKYRIHPGQDTNRPAAVVEGDALWIRMIDARSSTERVQLFGSELRFFTKMAEFLEKTTYQEAPAYARRRTGGVVEATPVSIVIPISDKHACADIDRAVHSALAQTHSNIELLLVDGAAGVPAARLRQLAAGDPRVRVIVPPETDLWGALNWGIGTAVGDYLALLVPGDAFTPHKIATQLRTMQERGELFSYTSTADSGEAAGPADEPASDVATGDLCPSIFALPPLALSTVMLHRSVISAGFAFGKGPAADLVGWAWIALRYSVLGLPDRLTVRSERDNPEQRLARRGALLAALAGDPVYSRAREGLRQLRQAIADDRDELQAHHAIKVASPGRKSNPLISIAMPVYNGGEYFKLALDSVLNQSYKHIEVVIVNDGSEDFGETEQISSVGDSRVMYISQENQGVAGALNTAIANMRGDVFCWLSHDDLFEVHKIEAQVEYHRKMGSRDAILFADYAVIDSVGNLVGEIVADHNLLTRSPMLALLTGSINGCTVYIPMDIFQDVGLFDRRRRYTQDYHLWNKMLRKYEFFHMPKRLVRYRVHPSQGSNRPEAVVEGDALWIEMMEDRSEIERVQMAGSTMRFYSRMAVHLEKSPYRLACAHAESQASRAIKETLISVIVPIESPPINVERIIAMALGQSHENIEIIVVGLPDAVSNLKSMNPKLRHIAIDDNSRAAIMNHAISRANGAYIVFADPTSVQSEHSVREQLRKMQEHGWLLSSRCRGQICPVSTVDLLIKGDITVSSVMFHRALGSTGAEFSDAALALGDSGALVPFARSQELVFGTTSG